MNKKRTDSPFLDSLQSIALVIWLLSNVVTVCPNECCNVIWLAKNTENKNKQTCRRKLPSCSANRKVFTVLTVSCDNSETVRDRMSVTINY